MENNKKIIALSFPIIIVVLTKSNSIHRLYINGHDIFHVQI